MLTKKQIPYDVSTRWNSTYIMIQEGIAYRAQLTQLVKDSPELQAYNLNSHDWVVLKGIGQVLKPFDIFTKAISKDQMPITDVPALYFKILEFMEQVVSE